MRDRVLWLVSGAVLATAGAFALWPRGAEVTELAEPARIENASVNAVHRTGLARDGGDGLGGDGRVLSTRDVAERVLSSVVFIEMRRGREGRATGSGFVIAKGQIVTNYHVIEGATSGDVTPVLSDEEGTAIDGILAADRENDLAIVSVPDLSSPPLAIGDESELSIGDPVYVASNPEGLEGTFTAGILSARRQHEGMKLLQITAPISPGSSGGAVVDARARVVGVAKGSWKDGQNLNFAVAAAHLNQLVADIGPLRPLAKVARPVLARRAMPRMHGELGPPSSPSSAATSRNPLVAVYRTVTGWFR